MSHPTHALRLTLATVAIALSTLALSLVNAGCTEIGGSACGPYAQGYDTAIAQEGMLSETVAEEAPYPMAIVISQDALNTLFAAVAGTDLPPLSLDADMLGVPITVTLRPQLPLLQVGGELDCVTCLLTEMAFGVDVDVDGSVVSGDGMGRYQFPLMLTPDGLESTTAYAQLASSEVLSVDFSISGLESEIMDIVEPLVVQGANYIIQDSLGDTELFKLYPWTIGDGDVRMLGRGPIIYPETRTIAIGIHTNLVQPLSRSIEVAPELPEGADIGMQFHPELVQQMISRMLFEGHIDRSYDATGAANAEGDFQVSLASMEGTENEMMRTAFSLWRTSGGLCGSADLQADMALSISDQALNLAIDNVLVTDAAGIGQALLVADQWMNSPFLQNVADFSEITLNYRELEIPGGMQADMSAESFRLDLDAHGLSIFLNIDQIVDIE